jgi:hypothetical protein
LTSAFSKAGDEPGSARVAPALMPFSIEIQEEPSKYHRTQPY